MVRSVRLPDRTTSLNQRHLVDSYRLESVRLNNILSFHSVPALSGLPLQQGYQSPPRDTPKGPKVHKDQRELLTYEDQTMEMDVDYS